MSAARPSIPVFVLAILLQAGGSERRVAHAQEEPLPSHAEASLRGLVKRQVEALNAEDPDAVMKVFHPKTPGARAIRRTLVNQFRLHDDQYAILEQHYVALDGRYAYMRTRQAIRGERRGKAFVTVIEELLVFRRHGKEWRAWTSARLDQTTRTPRPPGSRRR